MEPLLILKAPLGLDLSPVTQRLWAEKIVHRVIEIEGEQCLFIADPRQFPLVKGFIDDWHNGVRVEEPKESVSVGIFAGVMSALQTPVTLALVILLPLVYLAMQFSPFWHEWVSAGQTLWPEQRYALASYVDMGLWSLWRPTLLHFSLLHLLNNTFWCWVLGRALERRGEWIALVALIAVCGLAGNILQWWYQGPAFGGISGVVYGIVGWVGLRQRRYQIAYGIPPALMTVMVVIMAVTIAAETIEPGLTGIANGGHLGGLLAGLMLGWLWPVKKRGKHDA